VQNARLVAFLQQRQHQVGEQHRGQVIDAELHFVAVAGEFLLGRHHAGVVDQHVQFTEFAVDQSRVVAHIFQIGKVQRKQSHFGVRMAVLDASDGGLALGLVATGQGHFRAVAGQLFGGTVADAGIAAGNQNTLAHGLLR